MFLDSHLIRLKAGEMMSTRFARLDLEPAVPAGQTAETSLRLAGLRLQNAPPAGTQRKGRIAAEFRRQMRKTLQQRTMEERKLCRWLNCYSVSVYQWTMEPAVWRPY